jgi:hypothetical protein
VTSVEESPPLTALRLRQNHPNPFAQSTTVEIGLPAPATIRVEIYDVTGRKVRALETPGVAGWQTVSLAGVDDTGHRLASGVYFYRVQARGHTATRKMVIMR